jgi:hypothetical protein
MSFKKFNPEDLIFNIVKAHPQYTVHIYNGSVYINNDTEATGELGNAVKFASQGEISLHELNIDRASGNKIYPFVTKEGARSAFKTISTSTFDDVAQYTYGDEISGTYPLTASINRILVPAGTDHIPYDGSDGWVAAAANKKYIMALEPTFESYRHLTEHYAYSSSYGKKANQEVNLICIPSIFYGSSIKKGSVTLSYYVSGTLAAQVADKNGNGELVQVSGSTTGDVAGVVLYNEGIIALTGSWDIDSEHTEIYTVAPAVTPKWVNYGAGMPYVGTGNDLASLVSSSYGMTFEGTTSIPTVTMFAHASRGEYNYSNNPTFKQSGSGTPALYGDRSFEDSRGTIKNVVKSKYDNHSASFAKQTYISKIGIYDENDNLIAIASLANPVKKTEDRNYTFKLKLDF